MERASLLLLILVLQGEQGSAKSTTARLLKDLIDPSTVPLRTLPSCERDLAIAASKVWVPSVDNLSGLPVWLSDAFCRLATGGGFGTRTLFTDDTEILFNARRPLILNGISDIATRHDLADRALIVHLPPIPEKKRVSEKQLEAAWKKAKPDILKTLLDAVVSALRNLNDVVLPGLPRMADFATWVTAAEDGLRWTKGTFMKAYEANRMNLIDIALEADIVRDRCAMNLEFKHVPARDLINLLINICYLEQLKPNEDVLRRIIEHSEGKARVAVRELQQRYYAGDLEKITSPEITPTF